MIFAFNLIIIALTLFIAYWWANQGVFSALLHLLCVIAAGAIALAFWEPLAMVLLSGGKFDHYAWGVSLVGVFAVALLVLRFATDRLAPANVNVPHWANLTFGGALGLCAGILTMGITVIGIGFLQSTHPIMGWRGNGRDPNGRQIIEINRLWLPVNDMTSSFYGWLSVTSLSSSRPLRHYAPDLAAQANLVRDSYKNGRGQVSLADGTTRVVWVRFCAEENRYGVLVEFDNLARDYGEQLTISSAQVRLIEQPANRTAASRTVHPDRWTQYSGMHFFDDRSHYITSQTGQQNAQAVIEFQTPTDFTPRFIQVKNLRLELPRAEAVRACRELRNISGGRAAAADMNFASAGSISPHIRVSEDLRPITLGVNTMPANLNEVERQLTEGSGVIQQGGPRPSRSLQITGYYAPQGSRVVRVDVSRRTAADLSRFAEREGEDAAIALVDSSGNEYAPYGYVLERGDEYELRLEPSRLLPQFRDLPKLPSAGTQKLELLFHVTEGVTLVGMRMGNSPVGGCNLVVPARND